MVQEVLIKSIFSIYARTCMKNIIYSIHNNTSKRFWSHIQNTQTKRDCALHRDNWDKHQIDWRGQQSVLSPGLLWALRGIYYSRWLPASHSVHLVSRYHILVCCSHSVSSPPRLSLLPGIFARASTSSDLHLLCVLGLSTQTFSFLTCTSKVISSGLMALSLYLLPRPPPALQTHIPNCPPDISTCIVDRRASLTCPKPLWLPPPPSQPQTSPLPVFPSQWMTAPSLLLIRPQTLDCTLSLMQWIVQQIPLALPSKFTQDLTISHHHLSRPPAAPSFVKGTS